MNVIRPRESPARSTSVTRATPIGHAQQRLAPLHGDADAECRQHQSDDGDHPLQLHDQVEEARELRDLRLRHDGEAELAPLGQDRLERVEQCDALGVGLVDDVVEGGGDVDDDRAALLELLRQRRLLAGQDVDHRVVGVAVQGVPQLPELGALEELEREALHVAVHLVRRSASRSAWPWAAATAVTLFCTMCVEKSASVALAARWSTMTWLRASGAMVATYWSVLVTVRMAQTEITEIGDQQRRQDHQHPRGDPPRPVAPGASLRGVSGCPRRARDGARRGVSSGSMSFISARSFRQCLVPKGPSAHGCLPEYDKMDREVREARKQGVAIVV